MNSPVLDRQAMPNNCLPHQPPLPRAEAHAARAETDTPVRPIRALIVDDSPSVLKVLSMILEQQHNVQLIGTATDGYHALRRVVELAPDLVLMDLCLPGINGLEAARQIKARAQPPAVIMVTADDSPESRAAARAAGTDGFVGKKHLFPQLARAIRKLFPDPDP